MSPVDEPLTTEAVEFNKNLNSNNKSPEIDLENFSSGARNSVPQNPSKNVLD